LFPNPCGSKEFIHSELLIKPEVEALGQVFVKILPQEYGGYARVVQVLPLTSEGRPVISKNIEGNSDIAVIIILSPFINLKLVSMTCTSSSSASFHHT
jgi:hypothetical protein